MPHLAEALGRGEDARLLIIHADDMGMCHSANAASIAALAAGTVSCGSVMVPCPWFAPLAAWARAHPDVDLGVHLTLTSEWETYRWGPVAPVTRVPSLVDPDGFLWRSVADVVAHARPEEVAIELSAQIERARRFGLRPTHVDSHMGTLFADRRFFDAYLAAAEAADIPPMLVAPSPEIAQLARALGLDAPARLDALRSRGFFFLDRIHLGLRAETLADRSAALREALRQLTPGVTELIVHLAGDEPEIREITRAWRARYDEFRLFTDPQVRAWIEEEGIELIGYRELARLWRRQGRAADR